MKIKTSELSGKQLDWAVTEAIKLLEEVGCTFPKSSPNTKYSTDWALGGPIIESFVISVAADTADWFMEKVWFASVDDILVDPDEAIGVRGPTPLIAAMRCFVACKLGDEVEVPDELKGV